MTGETTMTGDLLLHGVELYGPQGRRGPVDCRVRDGVVAETGSRLRALPGEFVVRGNGGALLPGLADHHLHLMAMAAAHTSLDLSPLPRDGVATALARAAAGEDGWVRAVGYDDVLHGDLDRDTLDGWNRVVPVRVQHRSGALWLVNSPGLERLGAITAAHDGIERDGAGRPTGRLWRADAWMRGTLGGRPPSLRPVGARLAALGVTHVADATPDAGAAEAVAEAVRRSELPQRVMVMADGMDSLASGSPGGSASGPAAGAAGGSASGPAGGSAGGSAGRSASRSAGGSASGSAKESGDGSAGARLSIGPVKLVVADHTLPDLDELARRIRRAHAGGRPVAVHCVTRTALALTLAAFDQAGGADGDRVEHCAVADLSAAEELAARGVRVVTQPTLVTRRGDDYWARAEPEDRPDLWRYAGLLRAGVLVAPSSDAPYGDPDPWACLRSASERLTPSGRVLGPDERTPAGTVLRGFLSPLHDPGGPPRQVVAGLSADLVLLDRPLAEALRAPDSAHVRATFIEGRVVYGAENLA
ncbi:amidohydrolase family protein [Streptomyces sp. NPDC058614]|uniref:amidohydrolase family protein n=1 Tax=Streptomyces sp. NPDC058614 TaxID=3346557 RepID=UPI003650F76E